MAKLNREVYSRRELEDAVYSYGDIDACTHRDLVFDDDGNTIGSKDDYFVVSWPEHAITRQHIGDASVSGPYSRYVAESYVESDI